MIIKHTKSLCPVCYKEIPAKIDAREDGVFMVKACSEHGHFSAMVERSVDYYTRCLQSNASDIYSGYFLDVTTRCNLKCKYCFYKTEDTKDPSINFLADEVRLNAALAPILLTGGEPSLRDDLPEVVATVKQICPHIELLTNGTRITKDVFKSLKPCLTYPNGVIGLNLSIHPESNGKDYDLLEVARSEGARIGSALFVVDNLNDIEDALTFGREYKDVVASIRIKAASRLWAEQKPEDKIFVSDMWTQICKYHNPFVVWWKNNKRGFLNCSVDSMPYMLVSWYDVHNVDLLDLACPPYYKSRSGRIEEIEVACLINEGMEKGWLDGREYRGV